MGAVVVRGIAFGVEPSIGREGLADFGFEVMFLVQPRALTYSAAFKR